MSDIQALTPTGYTRVYEAIVVCGEGPLVYQGRRDDGLGRGEIRSIGVFLSVEEARQAAERACETIPNAIGSGTRAQHYLRDKPGPLHGKAERRYAVYEVPDDNMAPTANPGDRVEVDTAVQALPANQPDGLYIILAPNGDPILRRLQVELSTGRVRVSCDRERGERFDELDESELRILGRVRRIMNIRNV